MSIPFESYISTKKKIDSVMRNNNGDGEKSEKSMNSEVFIIE
jgi:hypothetical protein